MSDKTKSKKNPFKLRGLTAEKIKTMNTYHYAGFVGCVVSTDKSYMVNEITQKTQIFGQGKSIEAALLSFEKAVRKALRETTKNNQRNANILRFDKIQKIQSRVNKINQRELKRRVDRAKRMENRA